ncbi:phage tail spike protein [Marinilactibacillus psychrotolerans]|uniref:phage tail spike protein n=1 Tax=Marinilactibacillus psychrotolerans TaxID=191770 RepID=UPI00388619A1
MYRVTIYNDGIPTTIQEPLSTTVKLISGQVKKGINSFSSLELSMLPNNPGVNKMRNRQTLINVVDSINGEEVFWGQVLSLTDSMDSNGTFNYEYLCADGLSFLQDTIQDYAMIQNTTPEEFFRYLIDTHNEKVRDDFKRFTVGQVTVTNSTDNVYRYVDDTATTWQTIKDKLIDSLGGEIVFYRQGGVNYIDYLEQGGEQSETTIELSKNMISFSRNIDPTEVITVFKPRGARQESTGGDYQASQPRLTIASVNGGLDYLLASQALIDEFGYVEGSIAYDDITTPQALKTRGQQFLNAQKAALVKYNVSAVELSLLGLELNRFKVMNSYRTVNSVFGLNEYLRVVGMTIDLVNPQVSNLTIGDKQKSLSEYQSENNRRNRNVADVEETITNLVNNYNQQVAQISQNFQTVFTDLNDPDGIKDKLDEVQQQLNNLVIPTYEVATTTTNGLMSSTDKVKLNGLQNYDLATESINGLMSAIDKAKLNLITATESINLDDLNDRVTALETT